MLKEVSGEDPANAAVRQLCLSKVLNDRQHVFDDVGTGINGVELSKGSAGVDADPGDPGGPLCLEVEFGGQGRMTVVTWAPVPTRKSYGPAWLMALFSNSQTLRSGRTGVPSDQGR